MSGLREERRRNNPEISHNRVPKERRTLLPRFKAVVIGGCHLSMAGVHVPPVKEQ